MGFDNRHLFSGEINGQTLGDFRKLNYKENSLEKRLQLVNEKLESSKDENGLNFFENYTLKHYKDKLNSSDELSEKNEVFKTLENMANYLLGSEEIREIRKKEKQQYKFYIDETEFRLRTNKEQLFENVANDNDIKAENVIHFLLSKYNENYKLGSSISVTAKDIHEKDFCGDILYQYHQLLTHVDKQIKNPDEEYKGKRYILTKAKRDLIDDMTLVKTQLKGIIKPKHLLKDSTVTEWDCFNWGNRKHVKELIYIQTGFHPENEISFIIMDLKTLVQEMKQEGKLSKSEIKVYNLIRQGYKNNEIAEKLNVRRTYISNTVAVIVKKISNFAISKGWNN